MTDLSIVKPKKYSYFIGIDVSRNELDIAVITNNKLLFHKEIRNEIQSINDLIIELKSLPKFMVSRAVFCMEHTGFYCNHLLNALKKIKTTVALENPVHIKNTLGLVRDKNDKIDSIRIAQYALKYKDELRIWIPKRPVLIQLSSLFTLRNRLLNLQTIIKTPLKEQTDFVKKGVGKQNIQLCKSSVLAIATDLEAIDKAIDGVIESDEQLKRLYELTTSVPYIGRITGLQILISTNEFRDIRNPKKFACYAGVAPFKKESGMFKGKARVSHIANKKVKALLHICAVNACKRDVELKVYYHRKKEIEGKPAMSVLNAIRYKLITRVFACVNQNRLFEKDYNRIENIQQAN